MLFNARMSINHLIVALIAAPALTNAASLGNATTQAGASPQDVSRPTCYSGSFIGACDRFIDDYCSQISSIRFQPSDTEHRCYSSLPGRTKYKCVLGARNTNANQYDSPDVDECQQVLHNLVSACPQASIFSRLQE
ncbi:hypothetical protein GALMADRAFT_140145 [Galerina marginata CBS 339.88]|uniref:Glycan binding protein Y3-like domain-containing protein n=1 Tax=Galerina marginata (strain CBS 339.88) TaxID=685588 RepID=A0A067T6H4_GALM3|nr:hypothetical protein GALMADRAFT_140145 [Galerina marginata CBS 339.88]